MVDSFSPSLGLKRSSAFVPKNHHLDSQSISVLSNEVHASLSQLSISFSFSFFTSPDLAPLSSPSLCPSNPFRSSNLSNNPLPFPFSLSILASKSLRCRGVASQASSPPVPLLDWDEIGSDGRGGVGSSPRELRRERSMSHNSRIL